MNSWVRHEVGLELSDVHVKSTVESQRCGQRRNDLSDKSIQVSVGGSVYIKVSSADIIDSFVIKHNSNIGVF
jgi:heme/copper-type cytochrome/quinol oxidase subunit 2